MIVVRPSRRIENKLHSVGQQVVSVLGRQSWLDRPSYRFEHAVSFAFFPLGRARERVTNLLHGVWLGHPVHAPLAGLATGAVGTTVALDAVSLLPGRPAAEIRDASRFARRALGFGVLMNVAATITGLTDWQHTQERDRRIGAVHGMLNTLATGLYAVSLRERRRGRHRRGIVVGAFGYAVTIAGGYLGGHLVFESGIGTNRSGEPLHTPDWTPVLPLPSLPEQQLRRVEVDGAAVILCRAGEKISAVGEYCPHLAAPMADGWIDRGRMVCPWHGSRFDVDSGAVLRGPAAAPLPCYQTRVRDDVIEIRGGAGSGADR
ncbi:Rieske 2Fe-2S domain-containing protein [Mycobacterium sp. pUA109]|uniref:Rieske 2Fe-2S domain-containing protein n=1 Tax=Mycobacterium sp. pUA109 TaxID=3238982 RepID=UPI00351BB8DE